MTFWTRLLAALQTPPPDVIAPPDRPEWDAELRRQHGLTEIHRGTRDNLEYFAEHKPQGYAFTFGPRGRK